MISYYTFPGLGIKHARYETERISESTATAGLEYDVSKGIDGIVQLDKLGEDHAVVLEREGNGSFTLCVIDLP